MSSGPLGTSLCFPFSGFSSPPFFFVSDSSSHHPRAASTLALLAPTERRIQVSSGLMVETGGLAEG